MGLAFAFFFILALLFYPFTLQIKVKAGSLLIYWLPRLFLGFGRPIKLPHHKLNKSSKGNKRNLLQTWQRLRPIARAIRLQKYNFIFIPGNHFLQRFSAECIISISLSDIIIKSIKAKSIQRRRKHGRRIRD